jgi:ribosomal protein L22
MAEEKKKHEEKKEEPKMENKEQHTEHKHEEAKTETKLEEKKKEPKKIENKKRNNVAVNALSLHMSLKIGAHVCDMIRGKYIDNAIKMIEEVISMKRAVGMNNREIGHRHQKGIMAGRYPVNAAGDFLRILKTARAQAIYHEMEIESTKLGECKVNLATKPFKRGGAKAKRCHLYVRLEAKEENKKINKVEGKTKK